jgi:hypothetical protein
VPGERSAPPVQPAGTGRKLRNHAGNQRAEAVDHLAGKLLKATAAIVATLAAKCAFLVTTLRFVGIPEDALGWTAIAAHFLSPVATVEHKADRKPKMVTQRLPATTVGLRQPALAHQAQRPLNLSATCDPACCRG